MKPLIQKTLFFMVGCIAAVVFLLAGLYLYKKTERLKITEIVPNQARVYLNDRLGFSVEYPSSLSLIEESDNAVSFNHSSDEPWGFGIRVEPTSFVSTKEWLNAQPKASASSAGYEPILFLNSSDHGTLVVAEYLIVDHDGETPIYGKVMQGVQVGNGKLYKILYKNQYRLDQIPEMPSDIAALMSSFRVSNPGVD